VTPLAIEGAWFAAGEVTADERGSFREWLDGAEFLAATGRCLTLAQANCSVSRRGVIRGIHFTDVPPGQAKYVTCVAGAILDVVTDVRAGSPALGEWIAVTLDDSGGAVFISEGLGHAWMALTETAAMAYLCTQPYDPAAERAVHPLDPGIGIRWPDPPHILSARDAAAPTLDDAAALGLLPAWTPNGDR
jgi:dTDP-4-dehydrorhamnose 3,5-epimerase